MSFILVRLIRVSSDVLCWQWQLGLSLDLPIGYDNLSEEDIELVHQVLKVDRHKLVEDRLVSRACEDRQEDFISDCTKTLKDFLCDFQEGDSATNLIVG